MTGGEPLILIKVSPSVHYTSSTMTWCRKTVKKNVRNMSIDIRRQGTVSPFSLTFKTMFLLLDPVSMTGPTTTVMEDHLGLPLPRIAAPASERGLKRSQNCRHFTQSLLVINYKDHWSLSRISSHIDVKTANFSPEMLPVWCPVDNWDSPAAGSRSHTQHHHTCPVSVIRVTLVVDPLH